MQLTLQALPTEGDDVIIGTEGNDDIDGLGGDDTIDGLGGDDELEGGDGDDILYGGAGHDGLSAGNGIANLPTFLVGPDIAAGRVQLVLADTPPTELGIFALYAPNRYLAAKTRVFIDFLAGRFGAEPAWDAFLSAG